MISYETLRAWEARLEAVAENLRLHTEAHAFSPLEHDHASLLHDHAELTEGLHAAIRNSVQTHENENHEE